MTKAPIASVVTRSGQSMIVDRMIAGAKMVMPAASPRCTRKSSAPSTSPGPATWAIGIAGTASSTGASVTSAGKSTVRSGRCWCASGASDSDHVLPSTTALRRSTPGATLAAADTVTSMSRSASTASSRGSTA
jgi:hypothetical protein